MADFEIQHGAKVIWREVWNDGDPIDIERLRQPCDEKNLKTRSVDQIFTTLRENWTMLLKSTFVNLDLVDLLENNTFFDIDQTFDEKEVFELCKKIAPETGIDQDVVMKAFVLKIKSLLHDDSPEEFPEDSRYFEIARQNTNHDQHSTPSTDDHQEDNENLQVDDVSLGKFLTNLTRKAHQGTLTSVVGRDREQKEMVETLLRPEKSNVLLTGKAGVGKTALVEGLAQEIADDGIPPLSGHQIFSLNTGSLVAGTSYRGEFEERVEGFIQFARERDDVIIYIDEIHMVMGLGSTEGSATDLSNLLKVHLDRDEIQVIGSTTLSEYERFIKQDPAFDRRFNILRVDEMTADQTREVIDAVAENRETKLNVQVTPQARDEIVELSENCLHNRVFPDKAIDILDKSIGDALSEERQKVDRGTVREEVYNYLGFDVESNDELNNWLNNLSNRLEKRLSLASEEAKFVQQHLRRTLTGKDENPAQPNLILKIEDLERNSSRKIARRLADAIFGDQRRWIKIDLPPRGFLELSNHELGSHDGLFELYQKPASVVLLSPRQGHGGDSSVWRSSGEILREGYLKLADGSRVFFGDSIVLVEDGEQPEGTRVGFGGPAPDSLNSRENDPPIDLTI